MANFLIIAIGLIQALAIAGFIYWKSSKGLVIVRDATDKVSVQLAERETLLGELNDSVSKLVEFPAIQQKAFDLIEINESLKAERGRNTITGAELETVESRLRELEEIERELEASGLETKEELKILGRKEKDLTNKNDTLKDQINSSMEQVEQLLTQVQMSAEMQEKIDMMKTELLQTQDRIITLFNQIEQGNEQYFILKQRYDALDIEYAQLFEKFSEAEAALGVKKA